ncbi:MAG: glycoside hydrolase family 32 protein [Anaerolineaceae bacterium]|nr:glycoside hydrolase family 32 protein [Anaerolineaceae bacterium]MDE0328136.1 glycoside hydrolase family 32 protein [Anaerolineaceae bacterium]
MPSLYSLEEMQRQREALAIDWQRPTWHFLPPSCWMNDPNGLLQWGDQYHLFYQHYPFKAVHRDMHWGHAVSEDLIHWRDLPVPLAPVPGSYDESGVFTGCAVDNDGVPTVIYTATSGPGSQVQVQALATGSGEDLVRWERHPANPVLTEAPAISGQQRDFRDPFVWREEDGWYMVLGCRIEGNGGMIPLYRSPDLVDWEYLGPMITGDVDRHGRMWECPNFFPLGDKWVLYFSSIHDDRENTVYWMAGDFDGRRFHPETDGVLDYAYYYAPLCIEDSQGRRLMWGWLREGRSISEQVRADWSGVQAIPRVLSLDSQQRLVMEPVAEMAGIRGAHTQLGAQDVDGEHALDCGSLALELRASFAPQGQVGVKLAQAPDGSYGAAIHWDAATQELTVTRQDESLFNDSEPCTAPHELAAGETLDLLVLLDGSVLEVIANGRTSITSRIYPPDANCTGLALTGAGARLNALDVWQMQPTWP